MILIASLPIILLAAQRHKKIDAVGTINRQTLQRLIPDGISRYIRSSILRSTYIDGNIGDATPVQGKRDVKANRFAAACKCSGPFSFGFDLRRICALPKDLRIQTGVPM